MRRVGARAEEALRSLRPREAVAERARLRRPAAVLVVHGRGAFAGTRHRRAVRSRARRRVPGHQPAAGVDPAGAEAGRPGRDGRRRRRAIDLFVSCGDGPQHPRFSAAVRGTRPGGDAGAQLPLDAADPGRVQCRDRPRARALHQEPVDRTRVVRDAAVGRRARRSRSGAVRGRARARAARAGDDVEVAGRALPQLEPQRAAGARARPARHPVREVRRTQVPRSVAREGPAVGAALGRQPAQSAGRIPRGAARPRHRGGHRHAAPRRDGRDAAT